MSWFFATDEKTCNSTVLNHPHQGWIFAFKWCCMQDGYLYTEKQLTLSLHEIRISKSADQANRSRRACFNNMVSWKCILST